MAMPALMTLLDKASIKRRPNHTTGALEIFEALSIDHDWLFVRGESRGTPWHITHVKTGRTLSWAATTLAAARQLTYSGYVLSELKHRDARRAEIASEMAASA